MAFVDGQVRVGRYEVTAHRGLPTPPGSPASRRFLVLLDLQPFSGPVVDRVVIAFFDDIVVGDLGGATPNEVVANAPMSDFGDMYRIVQTEKPVFFRWAAEDGHLLNYVLRTGEEPVGEGLRDRGA